MICLRLAGQTIDVRCFGGSDDLRVGMVLLHYYDHMIGKGKGLLRSRAGSGGDHDGGKNGKEQSSGEWARGSVRGEEHKLNSQFANRLGAGIQ
jgi:hypothetical protein